MNLKRYINIILLKLSKKYKISLTEVKTYKDSKKYSIFKVIIYNYNKNENKEIETRTEKDLLLKLKEMI